MISVAEPNSFMADKLNIEVVAGDAKRQVFKRLTVSQGTTVREALLIADLEAQFPNLVVDPDRLGIFGRLVDPDQPLLDGDRLEVYRPLKADPKEIRRHLAELARKS